MPYFRRRNYLRMNILHVTINARGIGMTNEEEGIIRQINDRNIHEIQFKTGVTYVKLFSLLYEASYNKKIANQKRKKYLNLLKQYLFKYKITRNRFGVISDTHIGSPDENWDYIKWAYETFSENQIKEVIHAGDVFDGLCGFQDVEDEERKKEICKEQLQSFTKNYPKGFCNYVTYGNHEGYFFELGINLMTDMALLRKDFKPLGIGLGYIDWQEERIAVKHYIKKCQNPIYAFPADLILNGHSHFYKCKNDSNLRVPMCSDNHPSDNKRKNHRPGFLILEKEEDGILVERYGFENNKPVLLLQQTISKER